jgi:hypothetical protein
MGDSILTSARFWQQTGVRCVRTFAQAAGGVLGASATNVLSANWQQAATAGLMAAGIALLMSLEKLEELPPDNAEEAAVDAILHKQGIDSGAPLPKAPTPQTHAPPTPTVTPQQPVSITPTTYVPASPGSAAVTPPATTTGYPASPNYGGLPTASR